MPEGFLAHLPSRLAPPRASSRSAAWAAVLAVLCVVAGTRRAGASSEPAAPGVKRYTLRAEVVRLPEKPGGNLMLRHEAVDDFTDESGAVVGMDSMVMPFPVARGASLDGLAVGDKIEATLEVDWAQGFMQLERIQKLPRQTALHFGKARRPGKTSPHSGEEQRP
jgi:Cu/Ag efflux protein CusF